MEGVDQETGDHETWGKLWQSGFPFVRNRRSALVPTLIASVSHILSCQRKGRSSALANPLVTVREDSERLSICSAGQGLQSLCRNIAERNKQEAERQASSMGDAQEEDLCRIQRHLDGWAMAKGQFPHAHGCIHVYRQGAVTRYDGPSPEDEVKYTIEYVLQIVVADLRRECFTARLDFTARPVRVSD